MSPESKSRGGGRAKKGISDFIREFGDVLAEPARPEIERLIAEADQKGIPSKNLFSAYYRLRRAAGKTKPRARQPEPAGQPPKPEAPVPAPPASLQKKLTEALETIGVLVGEVLTGQKAAERELATLRAEKADLQRSLEEKRKLLQARAIREMEDLAMELPEHPDVLRAVQTAKAKLAVREEGVPDNLPRESAVEKVPVKYRESFLIEYRRLAKGERRQVAKAIRRLADEGYQYPALESKKLQHSLPGTPAGSWWCRASRELRFTWNRELKGGASVAILICDLVRRGDTRLGYTEA